MKKILQAASAATVALTLASAAHAASTTTVTPYNPADPIDLSKFENGNELAAQTITYRNDANGKGLDVIIQVNPAGPGADNADLSLGDQFTNLYFGTEAAGATIGFELGNDVFVPGPGNNTVYGPSAGIIYVNTPGTDYAHGGVGSMSTVYIPYIDFTTNILGLPGFTPFNVGDSLQLRDVQAFSYGGNNAGGDPRFGFVTLGGGVPEPASWALMIVGFGSAGAMLRRRRLAAA